MNGTIGLRLRRPALRRCVRREPYGLKPGRPVGLSTDGARPPTAPALPTLELRDRDGSPPADRLTIQVNDKPARASHPGCLPAFRPRAISPLCRSGSRPLSRSPCAGAWPEGALAQSVL